LFFTLQVRLGHYHYPLLHTAHLRRDSDATMANSWVLLQVDVLDKTN